MRHSTTNTGKRTDRQFTLSHMNERILVVDDETSVREVARAYLEREGFIVDAAADGRSALELIARNVPRLIILDLMLPDVSGEEVARQVRERSDVPILMLTAKESEEQRLAGFEAGADDYLTKPFSPRELVARVKVILRRAGTGDVPLVAELVFDHGRLRIDDAKHEVLVSDAPVSLTPSEYKVLLAIAQYPGRAYSRFELINRVQGHDFEGYERTIDAHVKNLRRKIEPNPRSPTYVQTVHGVGYKLGLRRE